MKRNELKVLKRKRNGFIMKNRENNVIIKCTEKFVCHWENLGFEVIETKQISLVS